MLHNRYEYWYFRMYLLFYLSYEILRSTEY